MGFGWEGEPLEPYRLHSNRTAVYKVGTVITRPQSNQGQFPKNKMLARKTCGKYALNSSPSMLIDYNTSNSDATEII